MREERLGGGEVAGGGIIERSPRALRPEFSAPQAWACGSGSTGCHATSHCCSATARYVWLFRSAREPGVSSEQPSEVHPGSLKRSRQRS